MVTVNIFELGMAAYGFKAIRNDIANALTSLSETLNTCGGSAGTDSAGKKWSDTFDPAAESAIKAATACVQGAAQMNDLLLVTQQNHDVANTAATIGEDPGAPAFPIGTLESFEGPKIPKFYGGESDAPLWWGFISSFVEGHIWPNGHQDQLRTAADAFNTAATSFDTAASKVPNARGLVAAQESDEIPQITAQATIVETEIKSVAAQFRDLATACSGYATAIDEAHSEILHELAELAAWTIAFEAIGWAAVVVTGGGSVVGGTAAATARAAYTGSRVARICEALVTAAEASAIPSIAAAGASARTVAAMQPLLLARMQLWATEAQGLAFSREWIQLSPWMRPTLRVGTRQTVRDAAPKRLVNGELYYISATDDSVLVPVAEQYIDPRITTLPKDPRGWYYVDDTAGLKYPVDPKPVFGHEYGNEWHRIRDRAISERWTREQLIEYCNNPALYRIEDLPGNQSHQFELPK